MVKIIFIMNFKLNFIELKRQVSMAPKRTCEYTSNFDFFFFFFKVDNRPPIKN